MTPQERQLVNELFDRLSRLEASPRDAEAERAIADGTARAPNALYALVQTVLVQDEALKRADARIRELSGADQNPASGGGFLDNTRTALSGHTATSVPSVRTAATNEPDPRWNSGGTISSGLAPGSQPATPYAAPSSGGSFLGTAAASAAGAIGGALLFSSIGSLFGHHSGSAFAQVPSDGGPPAASPSDSSATGSGLARDAGLNDIGNGGGGQGAGLFDAGGDNADIADIGGDIGGDGDSA